MALATSAAVAATAAAAAAAYLDAKFHITKDVGNMREQRQLAAMAQRLAQQNKRSLYYMFEEQALLRGDSACIWYRPTGDGAAPDTPPVTSSWRETYDSVNRYAQFLLENHVAPGDFVATYLMNSPDFIHHLLGSWAIGAAPALVNYHLTGEGLVHCLKVASSKILVVDEDEGCQQRVQQVRPRLEELGIRVVVLDAETKRSIHDKQAKRPDNTYRDHVAADFPIFLFYTSGTTGLPKACAFPTGKALVLGLPRLRSTTLQPGDVWYDCMPFYHGTGGTTAVCCMITGLTLAIGRKFSVRNFWKDIHDSSASAFVYVGETVRYLLAAPASPLDRAHQLKAMYGNGMRPDVWLQFTERFHVPVVNEFFNSTEGMFSLLNVCRGPFHVGHVGHHGALERRKFHNVFIPVEIDHETGQIWRDPVTGFAQRKKYEDGGEILVACKSDQDFSYWKNPEATEKKLERDVFRKGDVYYRTGDALRRDHDGRWYFLDRLGDTFRWKSENVSTAEVAEVLCRFSPSIVEANVYGVQLPNHDGRAGCAALYIPPAVRPDFDYTALLRHARQHLPRYAVPLFLRIVHTPSLMHNGKQSKVAPRREGVDPEKISTSEVLACREDEIRWLKPGKETYLPFTRGDWQELVGGKVRL
ncbi:long-chain fatty acid transport protein 1 [Sphaerulina musiva SO2202]|uniref:Very long-chain fatty acid transport protein n=1 Tax=Sphaerulina musiva (strain SO2202) TaxID=692275 RepID=N1QMQ5_SPHMS|nr:long-chain fatty acid transport protein 1 [Sphaerulina musiva SO2202]EMF17293.1 long-chain fatty acid transport protein 1 [Sphaerulina musiva SO2202]